MKILEISDYKENEAIRCEPHKRCKVKLEVNCGFLHLKKKIIIVDAHKESGMILFRISKDNEPIHCLDELILTYHDRLIKGDVVSFINREETLIDRSYEALND